MLDNGQFGVAREYQQSSYLVAILFKINENWWKVKIMSLQGWPYKNWRKHNLYLKLAKTNATTIQDFLNVLAHQTLVLKPDPYGGWHCHHEK